MSDRYFLDTNILIYSFDTKSPAKCRTARKLITEALKTKNGIISFQVVQEFSSVATAKFSSPFSTEDLRDYFLKILKPLCSVTWSMDLFLRALSVKSETKYSIYDSLIVAAAQKEACSILYSEDLQHGREVDGLRIVDPFKS